MSDERRQTEAVTLSFLISPVEPLIRLVHEGTAQRLWRSMPASCETAREFSERDLIAILKNRKKQKINYCSSLTVRALRTCGKQHAGSEPRRKQTLHACTHSMMKNCRCSHKLDKGGERQRDKHVKQRTAGGSIQTRPFRRDRRLRSISTWNALPHCLVTAGSGLTPIPFNGRIMLARKLL